jgi:hypothetical protein
MCGHHLQDGGVGDVARGAEEAGGRTRLPTRHQGDQPSQTEARGHRKYRLHSYQEVTKRCRLSWLTNSALVYESKGRGRGGGVAGCQSMSSAVHFT